MRASYDRVLDYWISLSHTPSASLCVASAFLLSTRDVDANRLILRYAIAPSWRSETGICCEETGEDWTDTVSYARVVFGGGGI